MHLSSITAYPIKACGGISSAAWELDAFGLRHDRRWMVVTPQGDFLTQREYPRLALVRVHVGETELLIEAPGMTPLSLVLEPPSGEPVTVQVWGDLCRATLPAPKADGWFTRFLGAELRLAYLPGESFRQVDPEYSASRRRVSFADGYPFLILGTGSLDDLNRRLAQPLPMSRFRPNLVVHGAEPFAEDRWRRIRVGSMEFDLVKSCDRCVVTTNDQTTAELGPEPLRTLATFRRAKGQVMCGRNAIHAGPGRVQVGDTVEVLRQE